MLVSMVSSGLLTVVLCCASTATLCAKSYNYSKLTVYFLADIGKKYTVLQENFDSFLPITFLLKGTTAEYFLFSRALQATISSIELPEPLASTGKRRD